MVAPAGFEGEAELVIEPIYGVREFLAYGAGLRAYAWNYWWSPGINVSDCRTIRDLGMEYQVDPLNEFQIIPRPPARRNHGLLNCSCGFYAYHSHRHLVERTNIERVRGIIEATGEVVIGSRGFRAEKAKIVALTVSDLKEPLLSDSYIRSLNLDAQLFNSFWEMMEAFPPTYLDAFPEEEYPRQR